MRLIREYILRQLTGPFLFALAGLTGFMLLNQVARRFGALVGKGLEWTVIAEVFGLSVPFIIAMTLPMAVLVAVLYTFSHLAADNEITAMRAGGLSVRQILTPVLIWGTVMAAANFAFVDQVVPRSNARLKSLLLDIYRKKPTFELREQVINEIPPSQYFLRAGRIDGKSGRLRDVVIYDVSDPRGRRIIYADSGRMGYAKGQTDLSLILYDGQVHELKSTDASEFRLTYFKTNNIRVKNVFDQLERNGATAGRDDREMSTCEMLAVVNTAHQRRDQVELDRAALLDRDLRTLLALPQLQAAAPAGLHRLPRYCTIVAELRGADQGTTDSVARAQAGTAPRRPPPDAPGPAAVRGPPPDVTRTDAGVQAIGVPPQATPPPPLALGSWAEVISLGDRWHEADRRSDRFLVEVHKKWTISVACIIFVMMGVVLALRFPRSGMGLVVGGGFGIFAIFYVFLTAGEALSDRGLVSPALSMWGPNILFGCAGVIGLALVNRESGSTRGGDWQEVVEGVRARVRRWKRRA